MIVAKRPLQLISFGDYQRLFRVITAVLNGAGANTPRACIFYALAGAYLISKFHNLPAHPVAGAAFYRLDDKTDFILGYGQITDTEVTCSNETFHCWIEVDGFAIDLMAPIFREALASYGHHEPIPRKMFQKPISAMSDWPHTMVKEGDFFLQPSRERTAAVFENSMKTHWSSDLTNVCCHWYKPMPKSMQSAIKMGSNDGSITSMRLSPIELVGAW